ncbi:MAG: carbamoyltransferase HypF [Campylobacterales bacterium]|nr:carbamoyltransferase HypF [Campylobacterales bacterium]
MRLSQTMKISGLVQGVGFRPFLYRLAQRYELKGSVCNTGSGVQLQLEGEAEQIECFVEAMRAELPPLSRIDTLSRSSTAWHGYETFSISKTQSHQTKRTLISADIGICETCLSEMQDPANRRYNYPFINCTDCGPRYSIMQGLPYDREKTSMRFFPLCAACEREYANPSDRRFHAEAISCFECGPRLRLCGRDGGLLCEGIKAIEMASMALLEGKILALKGLGGFHLLCDATNSEAVLQLRQKKQREAKPFAVMFADIDSLRNFAEITAGEEALICSKEKPIVIVQKKENLLLSGHISPGIERIGVFLPYTPLHHLVLQKVGRPLVASSANRKDEPILTQSAAVTERLGDMVDLVLEHEREIVNASDDSVMQTVDEKSVFLRMARGFAPKSIKLPFKSKKTILALGAQQKSTISLIFEDTLIISPHIGDLGSVEAFDCFERTIENLQKFYDLKADIIVCDMHPEYDTSRWAQKQKEDNPALALLRVQHHYAHILAVKAEQGLRGKVLGFAFDGSGYADDGTIWGSEVMIADERGYERQFSLRPFRLIGAEKAIKEPRRSALSWLFEELSLEELLVSDLAAVAEFSHEELTLLHTAWHKGINSPYSSSMGRLFDAVASLAGIVQVSSFEGESGLKMEAYVDEKITQSFSFDLHDGQIDTASMLREILCLSEAGEIISMFFNTLVEIISDVSRKHPELPLLFSGGVFQNKTLVRMIMKRCAQMKRSCYFQHETAINDGGISLGQAWFALHNQ